jgi:DNA-directed RNA polymerase subunit RPC12/RpoP
MKKPANNGGYVCMKCGSTAIYLSNTPMDHKGTISCLVCGGTEDSAIGIKRHGKEVSTYKNASFHEVAHESNT